MSCGNCVRHVREALEAIDGVSAVLVSLEGKNAEVEHAESVSADSLREAVEDAGYDVI